MSLQPARGTQTPAITRFQPGKPKLRHGSAEVIACKPRVLEKLFGDLNTYCMGTNILIISVATPVTEKSGRRVFTAG
jgi:hypothetical protein